MRPLPEQHKDRVRASQPAVVLALVTMAACAPDARAPNRERPVTDGPAAGADGAASGTAGAGSLADSILTLQQPVAAPAESPCAAGDCADEPACAADSDCEAGVCDMADGECVECLTDAQCEGETPACLDRGCVGCTDSDLHCGAGTPLCETSATTCVECLTDADCGDPAASRCDAGTCRPCTDNAHCTNVVAHDSSTELRICDLSGGDGLCVECTGAEYSGCGTCDPSEHDCGQKDQFAGAPLVCDSLAKACSDQPEASSGLCGKCVSDAECPAGQLCVPHEFDDTTIGYFCFWQKNAGQGGAPSSCSSARPYVEALPGTDSIDSATAEVCALRASSCPAHQDFSSPDANCAPAGTPDDTLCGEPGVSDAYCRLFEANPDVYRCTVPCLSDDDCRPGSDCDIMADPPHCVL